MYKVISHRAHTAWGVDLGLPGTPEPLRRTAPSTPTFDDAGGDAGGVPSPFSSPVKMDPKSIDGASTTKVLAAKFSTYGYCLDGDDAESARQTTFLLLPEEVPCPKLPPKIRGATTYSKKIDEETDLPEIVRSLDGIKVANDRRIYLGHIGPRPEENGWDFMQRLLNAAMDQTLTRICVVGGVFNTDPDRRDSQSSGVLPNIFCQKGAEGQFEYFLESHAAGWETQVTPVEQTEDMGNPVVNKVLISVAPPGRRDHSKVIEFFHVVHLSFRDAESDAGIDLILAQLTLRDYSLLAEMFVRRKAREGSYFACNDGSTDSAVFALAESIFGELEGERRAMAYKAEITMQELNSRVEELFGGRSSVFSNKETRNVLVMAAFRIAKCAIFAYRQGTDKAYAVPMLERQITSYSPTRKTGFRTFRVDPYAQGDLAPVPANSAGAWVPQQGGRFSSRVYPEGGQGAALLHMSHRSESSAAPSQVRLEFDPDAVGATPGAGPSIARTLSFRTPVARPVDPLSARIICSDEDGSRVTFMYLYGQYGLSDPNKTWFLNPEILANKERSRGDAQIALRELAAFFNPIAQRLLGIVQNSRILDVADKNDLISSLKVRRNSMHDTASTIEVEALMAFIRQINMSENSYSSINRLGQIPVLFDALMNPAYQTHPWKVRLAYAKSALDLFSQTHFSSES